MAERIDLKQFNMPNEKVVQTNALYIELAGDYFLYHGDYYAMQPKGNDPDDHTLGWEEVYFNFKHKIKRKCLIALDRIFSEKYDNWRLELEFDGYPNTIRLYFQTESAADAVYQVLDKFIFGTS